MIEYIIRKNTDFLSEQKCKQSDFLANGADLIDRR